MWFFYAITFALISSFSVIIAKRVMREMDQYIYLLVSSLFTAPFLLIIALVFFKLPSLDSTFWLVTVVGTAISATGGILAYKAIKESEVSLISPISAFNPVFTAIISFFTLGEVISTRDALGITTIVAGAYILQVSKTRRGFFEPIKALVTHKGVQLSFGAYFLWAITPSFEKTAIFHTTPQNPSFAAFIGQLIAILIYIPVVMKLSDRPFERVKANLRWFLLVGILGGLGITSAFLAFSLSPLGVATAVFKLSMIFTVILGGLFFKEKNIKERLLGSLVMLVGVILLVT